MTSYTRALKVVLLTAVAAGACNSQDTRSDQRVAELEQRLAETEKRLAESAEKARPVEQSPLPPAEPPAAPTPKPAPPPARPAPSKPPRAMQPPDSQKYMTAEQAEKEKAEVQRLADQQRAVNAKQAEANVRLQQQVDRLKPRELTIPAGTVVPVRTTSELSTATLAKGSTFDAILESDLVVDDAVVAPARARVTGVVLTSDPGGRVGGLASLTVTLRSIVGPRNAVIAVATDAYSVDAESTKKRDAIRTGVATGIGAIIGGIAGGGSGAAKGAGAGAATGVGVNLATRGAAAVIPAEELIEFRLTSPVAVTLQP